MGVKSKNHCFKQLVGLMSGQLNVDSGRAAATGASEWWGDAVADAGVVSNRASDGSPSARWLRGKAPSDELRGTTGIIQGALLRWDLAVAPENLHWDKCPFVTSKSRLRTLTAVVTA